MLATKMRPSQSYSIVPVLLGVVMNTKVKNCDVLHGAQFSSVKRVGMSVLIEIL